MMLSRSGFCQVGGHADRLDQGLRIGPAFPCLSKGGAVVHGSADNGKTEGHIDAGELPPRSRLVIVLEAYELGGDVTLIVVHDHHGVIHAALHLRENRIRRDRPFHEHAESASLGHGGKDFLLVFVTEEPAFAAMGVQSGHADAGGVNAKALQGIGW